MFGSRWRLAPFNFFTVAEAAELLECDRETVRLHIRPSTSKPEAEMKRLLAEHTRSLPAKYAKRAGFDTPALWQNDRLT